jgi:transcription-repair coupling factor (superfamily II helicase)
MLRVKEWANSLEQNLKISGLSGSSSALVFSSLFKAVPQHHIIIMNDADEAGYLYNDLKLLLSENEIYFFPSSFKRAIKLSQLDASNDILRTEVLNRLAIILSRAWLLPILTRSCKKLFRFKVCVKKP